jgi:hypothetical protein
MRTDYAADTRLDAMLENCIFYIFRMYEISHSLGPRADFVRPAISFLPRAGRALPCYHNFYMQVLRQSHSPKNDVTQRIEVIYYWLPCDLNVTQIHKTPAPKEL